MSGALKENLSERLFLCYARCSVYKGGAENDAGAIDAE